MPGDLGRHHDFLQAAMLQNTYVALRASNTKNTDDTDFETAMINLASGLVDECKVLENTFKYC